MAGGANVPESRGSDLPMNADVRHPTRLPGAVLRERSYAAGCTQPRHHHARTSVTLVFGGSLEEDVGAARELAGPLSVVFKPAGTEHSDRVGPSGAVTLQLELDDDVVDGPGEPVRPEDWGWSHGGAASRRFLELVCGARDGEPEVELEERLLDLLGTLRPGSGVGERPDPAPGWLARVAEELDDTFADPRRVRELARDVSVHPVALARAHRRHFGCSITGRLRARRVREAAALLRAGGCSLSSVAFRTGFADQSHFTRVFRTETGLTPGAYRSLLAG